MLAGLAVFEPGVRAVAGPALILGLSIFTVSALNGGNAILNAREELHWSSFLSALVPVLTFAIGWALLSWHPGLLAATLPSAIAGLVAVAAAAVLFRFKGIHPEAIVRRADLARLLRTGAPFLLLTLLGTLNVTLDTLLLKPLAGEEATGIYNLSLIHI